MVGDSEILCIGSVLWDVIGRTDSPISQGADMPGRIIRHPGGVAFNIARTLLGFGARPTLLSAVGRDTQGDDLLSCCVQLGMNTAHIHRADDLATDRYMAIEGPNGLIAAVADAHTLEAAGAAILEPLQNGALGSEQAPYAGLVALDGNLTQSLLDHIAQSGLMRAADLRVVPASPGKAARLMPFLKAGRGTLYVNMSEATCLCGREFATSRDAALALLDLGAQRAVVTNGDKPACDASDHGVLQGNPPEVPVRRITGAGDTFMAAHIAAEADGHNGEPALEQALQAAARHVSGDTEI